MLMPFRVGLTHCAGCSVWYLILMTISFQVAHGIKLYPPGTPANTIPESTEPVVAESYDEVVFTDPTESFFGLLERIAYTPSVEYSQREHFTVYSDQDICTALLEAQKFLHQELATVKNRFRTIDVEIQQVDTALREQARKAPTQRAASARATAAPSAKATTSTATTAPPSKKAKPS